MKRDFNLGKYKLETSRMIKEAQLLVPDDLEISVQLPKIIFNLRKAFLDKNLRYELLNDVNNYGYASDVPSAGMCWAVVDMIYHIPRMSEFITVAFVSESDWQHGANHFWIENKFDDTQRSDPTSDQFVNMSVPYHLGQDYEMPKEAGEQAKILANYIGIKLEQR
jgi:hypothetical protein